MNKFISYIKHERKRTPTVTKYLSRKMDNQLKKGHFKQVEITAAILEVVVRNSDMALVAPHVMNIVQKMMRHQVVQVRMLALEIVLVYIEFRDKEDMLLEDSARFSQLLPLIIKTCQYRPPNDCESHYTIHSDTDPLISTMSHELGGGSGGHSVSVPDKHPYNGLKWAEGAVTHLARKIALRVLYQLTIVLPDTIEKRLADILSPIILNTIVDFTDTADVTLSYGHESELSNIVAMKESESLPQLAHNLLAAMASQHSVVSVMNLIEQLILCLDEQNLWTEKGQANVTSEAVIKVVGTLASSVQPQHNHIIFSLLFRHLDADTIPVTVKRSVIEVITFASRTVHPTGPWVLEGLNSVTRQLADLPDNHASMLKPVLLTCLSTLAHRLQFPSQTLEVTQTILQRLPSVKNVFKQMTTDSFAFGRNLVNDELLSSPVVTLQGAQLYAQRGLMEAIVSILDSSPSISKMITLTSASKLLRTLLFVLLTRDAQTRLLSLEIVYSLFTGERVEKTRETFGMELNPDITWISRAVPNSSDTSPKQFEVNSLPSPALTRFSTESSWLGSRSRNSRRRESSAAMSSGGMGWQGLDSDWLLIHDVAYRLLLMPNNTEWTLEYLSHILLELLARYPVQHITTMVPILFAAQSKLSSLDAPTDAILRSYNGAQLVIILHFRAVSAHTAFGQTECIMAELIGNAKVSALCRSIIDERQRAQQLHPRLRVLDNHIAVEAIAPLTMIEPVTLLLSHADVVDTFPANSMAEEALGTSQSEIAYLLTSAELSLPYKPPDSFDFFGAQPIKAKEQIRKGKEANQTIKSHHSKSTFHDVVGSVTQSDLEEDDSHTNHHTNFDQMLSLVMKGKQANDRLHNTLERMKVHSVRAPNSVLFALSSPTPSRSNKDTLAQAKGEEIDDSEDESEGEVYGSLPTPHKAVNHMPAILSD